LHSLDENASSNIVNSNAGTRKSKREIVKKQTVYKATRDTKAKMLRSASVPNVPSSMIKSVAKKGSGVVVKMPTKPQAPKLHTSSSSSSKILSSEELELSKVEEAKKAYEEKRRTEKTLYEQFKSRGSTASSAVVRSTKELTKPQEPKFKLSSRLGKRSYSIAKTHEEELKPETAVFAEHHTGPTVVKPFKFETEKRAKLRGSESLLGSVCPIIPAAEIEQSFMRDARSHVVPDLDVTRLTEPRTPNLMTKRRAESDMRIAGLKSRDELEQEEMEAFQKNPFKANPVDKRIFESSGPIGVPKPAMRPLTEPQPFNLRIDQRSSSRASILVAPEPEEQHSFRALPLPQFSPRPISPRPPESNKPLTVPVSPKLHGKDRASSAPAHRQKPHHAEVERKRVEELEAYKATFHALNHQAPPKVTQPREFHFRTSLRSQSRLAQESEQQREAEQQLREFKARPVPKFQSAPKVATSAKPRTEIKEFSLRSTKRHEVAQASFQKQVEERAQIEASVKRFR
jgi:hypothetical protein